MKKYLKMIPVMFYPYAYLIPLIILFSTPAEGDNMDFVLRFVFVYALVLHILVLFIVIYNSIVTGMGKYKLTEATKINMLTKCVQIPAYIFHFCLGLLGLIMSIWGIGIILFVIAVDFITIAFTGISSIGCSCLMAKRKALNNSLAVLLGIGSFIYCIDVAISIVYYMIATNKNMVSINETDTDCKAI